MLKGLTGCWTLQRVPPLWSVKAEKYKKTLRLFLQRQKVKPCLTENVCLAAYSQQQQQQQAFLPCIHLVFFESANILSLSLTGILTTATADGFRFKCLLAPFFSHHLRSTSSTSLQSHRLLFNEKRRGRKNESKSDFEMFVAEKKLRIKSWMKWACQWKHFLIQQLANWAFFSFYASALFHWLLRVDADVAD